MIQSSDVEILVSQADGGVSVEIVGGAPIEDKARVISKLPEREEQAVAEVCRYGRQVWDRNHFSSLLLLLLSLSLSISVVMRSGKICAFLFLTGERRERFELDLFPFLLLKKTKGSFESYK